MRTVQSEYTGTRRSAIVYPNGRWVGLDWEAMGALQSIGDEGQAPVAVYDWIGGRVLCRQMDNGVNLDMRNGSATWYDGVGRPVRYGHVDINQQGEPVLIGFEQTYDRVGNKLSQASIHDPRDSQRYAYDSASRLTSFVRGTIPTGQGVDPRCDPPAQQPPIGMTQGQEWDLDGVGNWSLTRTKIDDETTPESRGDTNFNEYCSIGVSPVTHDDNGNLVDDGGRQYSWDAFNRLRIATEDMSTLGTYLYDATNRRVRKILPSPAPDTDFSYDGWQIVEEHEDGATNPARQFVYGVYIDEPLAMDVNGNADSTCIGQGDARYFYHQNTIYSVYALTDSTGALVEAYEYDPYGKHWLLAPGEDEEWFTSDDLRQPLTSSTLSNPYTFTGREFDPETGLHCYRNRYYAADLGSFIRRDPMIFKDGPGFYVYVRNNPLNRVDPNGSDIVIVGGCSKCGPEISHQLSHVLDTVTRDYGSWDDDTKKEKCFSLFGDLGGAVHAWDIPELQPTGPTDDCVPVGCATDRCKETVRVQGGCHLRHAVNYVFLGHITRLCGNDFIEARNWIWWYTMFLSGDSGEKLDWFYAGYFGNYPPAAPAAYASCKFCGKGSTKDEFTYHWGS